MKLAITILLPFFWLHVRIVRLLRLAGLSAACRQAYWKVRLRSLGDGTLIYPKVVIHSPARVSIGDCSSIAEFSHIWGGGGVEIGNNVLVASHVAIISVTHDPDGKIFRETNIVKAVTIEDNVWVGAHAVLLPGITLGRGCIIGAGAVVTKDVPSETIVAGIPASILRQRSQPGT